MIPSFGHRAIADVPNVLQDADPNFLESWQIEIDKQIELLSAAYALDEDAKANLRTELGQRLIQEHDYEATMNAQLDELSRKAEQAGVTDDPDSPEMKAVADRFMALTQTMPLNEQEVVKWVEARVPPAVAQEGRQRWEELLVRREQMEAAAQDQNARAAGRKAEMAGEMRKMQPRYTKEEGVPMPGGDNGDFVDAETMRRAGREYVNPADLAAAREGKGLAPQGSLVANSGRAALRPSPGVRPESPSRQTPNDSPQLNLADSKGPPPPPEPQRLRKTQQEQAARPSAPAAPAPPLDDWEKYVLSVSQKYGFDNGQNMRAQAILADLRKRAYQYQLSRTEEYARAKLMTDAKARGETLKRLDTPLDALFGELKLRLESLPTMSQKQRQGQPAKK